MVHGFRKKGVYFSSYTPWILEKGGIFHNAHGENNIELTLHGCVEKGVFFTMCVMLKNIIFSTFL